MAILTNPRHELFAQELAKGKSATEAYMLAGYKPCRQNAARLMTNDDIQTRLAEIQAAAAKASEVTIQSLLNELEDARVKASNLDQLSAAVRAIEAKAKVSGLLTQKIEVSGPGDFDGCETTAEMVDRMLAGPGSPIEQFRPVDARDRQGLIELMDRNFGEISEYIDAIKARPHVIVRCDLTQLKPNWQELELRPYGPWEETKRQRELERKQTGNGNQRRITNGNGQR